MATQLEGNITIGATDHSADITSIVITGTKATTEGGKTFADASPTVEVGGAEYSVTINFNHDEGDASNVFATLYTAFLTDSSEVAFTGTFKDEAVSATNPEWSGTIIVTDLDIGGTVGDKKQQSKTYPVKSFARAEA